MTSPTCDAKGTVLVLGERSGAFSNRRCNVCFWTRQEVPRATDAVGNTITPGNLVAYAALNYKRAVLRTGRIVEIEGDRVRVRGDHHPQRRVWEKAVNVVRIG